MSNPSSVDLLNGVVRNGFCSGCGACAYTSGTRMALNEFGEYQPDLVAMLPATTVGPPLSTVCPSLHPELNEDTLARPLFANSCTHDARIGYHAAIYAGFVREGDYRAKGTSGGIGTWLGTELLRRRLIDGVIHVKPVEHRTSSVGPFFAFAISRSVEDIRSGAQTRYHAVEMSKVMAEVRAQHGRYLFIGLPCFCKAVRRLQRVDAVIADRIRFVGSLVCGHLKSVHWTLALAWAAGIPPDRLETLQYRTKRPNISAQAYVFTATPKGGDSHTLHRNASTVAGGKWNASAMMLNACDYCDDVVGETADISIGDAWLPKYQTDPGGTNLVIVRDIELTKILSTAAREGRLQLERVTADEAATSQDGGLRHRREGLSYRLAKAQAEGRDVPVKRVAPGSIELTEQRKRVYDARTAFAAASRLSFREALERRDYSVFSTGMKRYEDHFRILELGTTLPRRLLFSIFSETFLREVLDVRRTLPHRIMQQIKIRWTVLRNCIVHH